VRVLFINHRDEPATGLFESCPAALPGWPPQSVKTVAGDAGPHPAQSRVIRLRNAAKTVIFRVHRGKWRGD
jgi:hypothetical protein